MSDITSTGDSQSADGDGEPTSDATDVAPTGAEGEAVLELGVESTVPASGDGGSGDLGAAGSGGNSGSGGSGAGGGSGGSDDSGGSIEPIEIQTEMEASFLEYAMSVIVSRALPDVRDGLKPVHRRILWAMLDAGLRPDRSHRKCATVVGDVIGKYHPHGDTAVYDALVRMGQTFSLRHTLIDPHGNFGSPSDPPAAYRYTECRLTKLAMEMLRDIDEDTVDFNDNFDGSEEEPTVLPSRFPNLLVNGSQGIAVGMATNIPPHNLGEVIDATVHLIDNPEATPDDLMAFVKGPDFPTANLILGRGGIRDAYRTGRGSVKLRAVAEIEEGQRSDRIVVTAIPYQTSVEAIAEKSSDAVKRGDIEGIREIRNESAKGKTRLVFELKQGAPGLITLNQLYKYTPMQTTFSVNMVALVDGVPRTLNLQQVLAAYVAHQVEVIRRRSEYRLQKAKDRAHIIEGYIKALDLIDQIIALIRGSEDRSEARSGLMGVGFEFSEIQANHILDLPLGRLTRLGRRELEAELAELREKIAELEAILADEGRMRQVIKDELGAVREEFATDRMCEMTFDEGDFDIEDLIDDEEVVVVMTGNGYIKSVAVDAFRAQARGGRGVSGARLKDDDYVRHLLHTSAHAYLLFFTNTGRVYRLKAHRIPMVDRTARGTAIVNLLQLADGERIQAIIDTRDYETNRYLMFCTRNGTVKKTRFTEYDKNLKAGFIAIGLRDGDELVEVFPTSGDDDIFITTGYGQTLRFSETQVRDMGRTAGGVRGIKLRGDDQVVGCDAVEPDTLFLLLTEQGYGKRTDPDAFATKGRGGMGMRSMKIDDRKGSVVGAFMVGEEDEIFIITSGGVVIRTKVADISTQGRDATGVRVMNVDGGERVVAITPAPPSEDDDEDPDGTDPDGGAGPDGAGVTDSNGRSDDRDRAEGGPDQGAAPASDLGPVEGATDPDERPDPQASAGPGSDLGPVEGSVDPDDGLAGPDGSGEADSV